MPNNNTITITSAVEFPIDLKATLESKLIVRFGQYPFVYQIDNSILAGLTARLGDTEITLDLKSEIEHIQSELI